MWPWVATGREALTLRAPIPKPCWWITSGSIARSNAESTNQKADFLFVNLSVPLWLSAFPRQLRDNRRPQLRDTAGAQGQDHVAVFRRRNRRCNRLRG